MRRPFILLLAVACGAAVGNVYFPQAITPEIAAALHVTPDAATVVATAVQFGYAAGIFLLVPLGDRYPYRRLIVAMFAATGLSLLAASRAPALLPLVAASALIGVTTTSAQVIAPMVAGLAGDRRRGAVLGMVLSGAIAGTLLARAFGGIVGEWLGWRAPYALAAALALAMAVVLAIALPRTVAPSRQSYPALLAGPLRLLRTEPDLRRSCFYQTTVFASFSAVWTGVALLLTGPAYGLGTQAVGLLALVGAGTMVCTPLAGREADRRGPDRVNVLSMLGTLASAVILAVGGGGGTLGLSALVLGTLVLDVSMQSGQVANHARIFALGGEARGRLNTAYMTCVFLGGGVGSWLGARSFVHLGWTGLCTLVAVLATIGLGGHVMTRVRARPSGCAP